MTFSAIGAGLAALVSLDPGLPTVTTVVHAVGTRLVERPHDTNAVRVEPRIRVPRDASGRELASAKAEPVIYLTVGLISLALSEADAMRAAGRLRAEAHVKTTPPHVRVGMLLVAAKLHTAAAQASAYIASARRSA